ncbi:MAG: polysaccharide biosynthesis tyrosine autokinase [Acidobacteria bacterium]|nr:polysaccharide biosynthesis tyrosine autokinase [Acidobacteriota bacterium]
MPEESFEQTQPARRPIGGALGPVQRLTPMAAYQQSPLGPATVILSEGDAERVSLPLSHYIWILRRHLWKMAAFVAVVLIATAVVSLRMTPVYESTATLYVDRQEAKGVVGQEAQNQAYSTLDAESFLASQIKLIQSDSVVRPVALRYNLLEKEQQLSETGDAVRAKDAPIVLKKLKVVRPPNTYLLQISYQSTDPQLAADVANQVAQSYIEHTYNIRIKSSVSLSKFMERQIEELRAKMETSSGRLAQMERELNVINPEEKTNILSARLLQLNTEYTKAQAERVAAEAAFASTKSGSLESAQVSAQGEAIKRLLERQNEATEKFAEVKAHFGVNHPEYRKAQAQVQELKSQVEATRENAIKRVEVQYKEAQAREAMLQKGVAETKAEYDKLNLRSFEYQRAKREAEADKNLYDELVRKIREAGINAGFQNNMVRIADPARSGWKPVFPKLGLNLALALLFASLLAVGIAILGDTLDNTIRDPEQVTRSLKTHIIGTLPSVKNTKELQLPSMTADEAVMKADGSLLPAPLETSKDRQLTTYEEAVRTIRSSVLLTDFDRRLRTLLFTSATASEGKSTTAGHLAFAHAEQKKKTLLIDCDLRRPSQHKLFGIGLHMGLSNVLNGEMSWQESVLHLATNPYLDVITAGPPSRRAADMIGQLLGPMMEEMARDYDLVVLDAPPLLGFAESLQMASSADGVVVVTRAGETSRKAVAAALTTLAHLRANVLGLVLNQVKKHHSDHYYYYGYYGKYYKKYQKAAEEA